MPSSVGLEAMNSTKPELNWKTVTKGRRSRKSTARSLNGVSKIGNSTSPKRVGDFSGSDSDKIGEVVLGQSTSSISKSVPINKMRHLLQSPSPHLWSPPLRRQDSASPHTCSSPFFEDQEQLLYSVSQRSSSWQVRGIEESAKVRFGEGFHNLFPGDQTKLEYKDTGDFSGIELLAAAASMDDDDDDNANKHDLVAEGSIMPKNSDASCSATLSTVCLKSNEPENSSSDTTVQGGNTDCSPVLSSSTAASQSIHTEDGTMPKVNRQHWDLNTLMDAWDEPYDDSIAGNTSNDVNGDMNMEESRKAYSDHVLPNPGGTEDEYFNLKIEENKLTTVSPDRVCSVRLSLEKHLGEPPSTPYFYAVGETSYQAAEKDASERNTTKASNCDAHMDTYNQVMVTDSILDSSPFTKPSCSSGLLMSEEKLKSIDTGAKIPNEDCSSNVRESERTSASDRILTRTRDVIAHDMSTSEISESPIDVQCKDNINSQKTSETPGTFMQDSRLVLAADSEIQNDANCLSGSTITDSQGHLGVAALIAKHEDNNILANESTTNVTEDSSKSCSAGAQDDPTASVGKIGLATDGPPNSDVSQNNHVNMVDGDDLTGFQEGYDSPYEDGELRGSFLFSWEDNEMENECVDYESDGRNGDGSDAADYPGSDIVEGGSEGSHSLLVKGFSGGQSKGEPAKRCLRSSFNNEIAGKGSNAGSGTTVEQSMEMLIDENDDYMGRSQLTDRRDTFDVKYASKTVRGQPHSRIEGRSSMDATDGKDGFFIQQCRSRYVGSYSRSERDISPDKYLGRYRQTTHGERDGVHQWGSRRRDTSSYQGAEVRTHTRSRSNKTGDSADKGGLDFHDPRQNVNYLPKGLHRPFMRRSPMERDNHFGASRRMPPTRGVGNYRSKGHYSQCSGRGFGHDDFEPLPNDAGPPVRSMPRYLSSNRERSFSPSFGRNPHMALPPRRRSRSRSRTRSPRAWHHPHREQRPLRGNRRNNSRSPDFRPEPRTERMRMPFLKPNFASDYNGEGGYVSPSRVRFSPQRNCRWVGDRSKFADNNYIRRRRSPVRVFKRTTQRFDAKSDECFRPTMRPGRFSFMANGGRECKLEPNYDDRRRDDGGDVMQRALLSDDGGNIRRYRQHNAVNGFEKSNLNNNEADVQRDVRQTEGDREEDKRALEI